MRKCDGCIFLGEYSSHGAYSDVCNYHYHFSKSLNLAVQECENEEECEHKVTFDELILYERCRSHYAKKREELFKHIDGTFVTLKKAISEDHDVEDMPAADVVAVVRCKECKHLTVINCGGAYARCEKTGYVFWSFRTDTREHYCAFGERR